MNMNEYESKFLELLRYMEFIKYEKVKIPRLLSELPTFYKDKIQYDGPKNFQQNIGKDKYMYEQSKRRETFQKSWKERKKEKVEERIRGFKPPSYFRSIPDVYKKIQETHS